MGQAFGTLEGDVEPIRIVGREADVAGGFELAGVVPAHFERRTDDVGKADTGGTKIVVQLIDGFVDAHDRGRSELTGERALGFEWLHVGLEALQQSPPYLLCGDGDDLQWRF